MRWTKHINTQTHATEIHANFGNLKWKRTPVRPSCRCKDDIKIDLEELGWTGFM